MPRLIFGRVGWMRFYNGPAPGDRRPVEGGRYNEDKIGGEVYNFKTSNSHLYGFFRPVSKTIALERKDPIAKKSDNLDGVLVIFVARRPGGGQVIIGWYRDAEVSRRRVKKSPGKPCGWGHFVAADRSKCVLLPTTKRRTLIPAGKGAYGMSHVCYALEANGKPKPFKWIQDALELVEQYDGGNLLDHPELEAEAESANAADDSLAGAQGQGFAQSAEERRAIETHAMKAASTYFRSKGFSVTDVSSRQPFDLLCKRNGRVLHVEVKGTTSDGSAVFLTHNEAIHACDGTAACALFILHSITLSAKRATGGQHRVFHPWKLKRDQLTPISYTYRV